MTQRAKKSPAAGRKAKGKTAPRARAASKTAPAAGTPADPLALAFILMNVMERTQPLIRDFLEKHDFDMKEIVFDPMNLRETFAVFMQHLLSDPQRLAQHQMRYWQEWMTLWQDSARRFLGGEGHELYAPEKGDRRFSAKAWQDSTFFDFIKQSYLMTGRWMEDLVECTEGLDEDTRNKVDFYVKQFVNAMAPTNFILTNPEVLQETLDTQGENLVRGLENLLKDLERGEGQLAISTTDYKAFEVGRNLALTPGSVVFENELMQLIQYEPATEKVHKKPLLIVPPWINKFYILDLRPENSFIKWVVEQGYTVFTISWVNPDRRLARKRFEDYMEEGVFAALEQVRTITGEKDCNVLGYCLGGTLLAITLGWMAAKGGNDRIASATFLTSLVDFEKAGDMKLFIDDVQLDLMETEMGEKGFLPAETLKRTFSMLRSNDLIWSFVVNNYLMGKEPFPFDLLYWNDDATNMPAAMHSFYLRRLYRENKLAQPGGITMNGTPIDVRRIDTPCYFLSTREDHIAPWKATYATTQLVKGEATFTLAASGHVAGVVNPPERKKYCYWSNAENPADPDAWFDKAVQHDGSWWPDWERWLKKQAGSLVAARPVGKGLEPAPGSYVKNRAK